jgi:nucleoside 2-deoxyribosyltransferase
MTERRADERKLKVYLAGPEVFLSEAIAIGLRKELCSRYGFEGLDPFDNEAFLVSL